MFKERRDDIPTLWAVGTTAAVTASLAHEALGHGLGCAIDRGSITLITFLVFRCAGAGPIADGGGPVGALVVGIAALTLLQAVRPNASAIRLFLLTLGALTLFWSFGQMMKEAIDQSDDWGHVARDLRWPPTWRGLVGGAGGAGYFATVLATAQFGRRVAAGEPRRLALPLLAAVSSAVVLGALWRGDRSGSALDGFLTFGVAQLGYLIAIRAVSRVTSRNEMPSVARSWPWISAATAVFVLFALTIGRGLGSLG